jgi:hypothetical protein
MKNNNLAIAIPTYNRCEILKENLLYMLDEIRKYNIPIYISDDSDNDLTKNMITELKKDYGYIYYFKNKPSLGHDRNCLYTLSLPDEEYIWYLGDSIRVKNGKIKDILEKITTNCYDLILVNSFERDFNISSKEYFSHSKFFVELAWHATLTGVTIYRKDLLNEIDFKKYLDTNFIQLGIILERALDIKNGILWINEGCISSNKKKKSYWSENIFEVFAKDWSDFILSLPEQYLYKDKLRVIQKHSDHTGIFKLKSYLMYRAEGILNFKSYIKYIKSLKLASSLNILNVFFLLLIPSFILKFSINILKSYKRLFVLKDS